MKKLILLFLFMSIPLYSQFKIQHYPVGKYTDASYDNGVRKSREVITAERVNGETHTFNEPVYPPFIYRGNTYTRWSFMDATAIGYHCTVSANGLYTVVSWDLNSKRISLYDNASSNPLWEFFVSSAATNGNVAISDTGYIIAAGSYKNIYVFERTSSTPIFNFDLTTLVDTGTAGPVELTKNGAYLIASASRSDSSTIFCFNKNSTTPVWSVRLKPEATTGGASIQGIKMSGNDSLIIVNSYGDFWVMKTFTGDIVYRGLINPVSTSGTQFPQGISGNGSIIATINYRGALRVFQWNGTTYNLLWEHIEPPGTYYNWMTAVDITYDGKYIASGTLNFITSSSYDGKVKFFETTNGGTPKWTYTGCGDQVGAVSLSRSGNILSASSWGAMDNSTNDLYIFKPFIGAVPIYTISTPGSFYDCKISEAAQTVVASGKRVHARTFGNGGYLYNISVDTNDVPVNKENITEIVNDGYELFQNYPNPFNASTVIKYTLPEDAVVILKVYSISGKEVAVLVNRYQTAGTYETFFSTENLTDFRFPSGIYFYTLQAGDRIITKKMTVLK